MEKKTLSATLLHDGILNSTTHPYFSDSFFCFCLFLSLTPLDGPLEISRQTNRCWAFLIKKFLFDLLSVLLFGEHKEHAYNQTDAAIMM